MYYGLTNSLGRNFMGSRGDADASAYIEAVVAAGATVSGAQRTAIDYYYVSAKADSYYTSLKRLYLPIWGVAAANAIDMIGLTSGTFVGGVTHAAGYVQGNGTTGYFNAGTAVAAGVATGSCSIFELVLDDASFYTGAYGAGPNFGGLQVADTGSNLIGHAPSDNSVMNLVATGGGVILVSQTSATARALYRRATSGFSTVASNTTNDTEPLAALDLYFGGGFNSNGSLAVPRTNRHGACGIGLGLTAGNATAFTLALKNLFETCTGLTLP